MEALHLLALTAGAINIWAFWLYNRDTLTGGTKPDPTTWFVWAVVTVIQAWTYDEMDVHWTTLVVMVSDTTLCVVTFFYQYYAGKFDKLDRRGWQILGGSAGILVLWKVTSSPTLANFLIQIPYAMAFWPTIRKARDGETVEVPKVWILFTLSFVIALDLVAFKNPENLWKYYSPVVAVVMHTVLAYYAIRGEHRLRFVKK